MRLTSKSAPAVMKKRHDRKAQPLRWCYTGQFVVQHCCAKNRYVFMAINLLQQRCKNLKSVQSCATHCCNKCCVNVTRVDFLCNNIALKSSRRTQEPYKYILSGVVTKFHGEKILNFFDNLPFPYGYIREGTHKLV